MVSMRLIILFVFLLAADSELPAKSEFISSRTGQKGSGSSKQEEIPKRASVQTLITYLNNGSWPVRAEAARRLGKMRTPAAIQPLVSPLGAKYWDLADTCPAAPQSIAPAAVTALIRALEDP